MMPERIQQRRARGWRKPAGAVSVVRGTEWGNPFRVGDVVQGMLPGGHPTKVTVTSPAAVELYRAWLLETHGPGIVEQLRRELGGKDLMCFCREGAPCHADVLLEVANS
jgi:hypothetical protein